MNTWYYRQADQEIGPFERDVLERLRHAGVIDDATPIKNSTVPDWRAFGEVRAEDARPTPDPVEGEPRYYYLDANRQPVGPFDVVTLRRLCDEGVITGETLTSAKGETQWLPLANRLGSLNGLFSGKESMRFLDFLANLFSTQDEPSGIAAASTTHPCYRSLTEYARMMIFTVTLYSFYLVPSYSRDTKAITGRERMEFTGLLILGIVTLGLALIVMEILWAFDLERHGKTSAKVGRQESLGIIVLVLNALGLVLGFAIDDSIMSFVIVGVFCAGALWMLQKEINHYADRHETA